MSVKANPATSCHALGSNSSETIACILSSRTAASLRPTPTTVRRGSGRQEAGGVGGEAGAEVVGAQTEGGEVVADGAVAVALVGGEVGLLRGAGAVVERLARQGVDLVHGAEVVGHELVEH